MAKPILGCAFLLLIVVGAEAKDPYKILGVDKNASQQEIKKAFHKLSLKYHPDKNASKSAQAKMAELSNAYELLSDEEKRKNYDLTGDESGRAPPESGFPGGGFNGFSGGFHGQNGRPGGGSQKTFYHNFQGGPDMGQYWQFHQNQQQAYTSRRKEEASQGWSGFNFPFDFGSGGGMFDTFFGSAGKKFQNARDSFGGFGGSDSGSGRSKQRKSVELSQTVQRLDSSAFLEKVSGPERDTWLVFFFRPVSSPELDERTSVLNSVAEDLSGIIQVGAVNCQMQSKLCRDNTPSVLHSNSPVLEIYTVPDKSTPYQFTGMWTDKAVKDFVVRNIPNFSTRVDNQKVIQLWTKLLDLPQAVLFTKKKDTPAIWRALSGVFEKRMKFYDMQVESKIDTKIGHQFGIKSFPAVVGMLGNGEDYVLATKKIFAQTGKNMVKELKKFLEDLEKKSKAAGVGMTGPGSEEGVQFLTKANAAVLCGSNTPLCILAFADSKEAQERSKQILTEVSQKTLVRRGLSYESKNPSVSYSMVHSSKQSKFLKSFKGVTVRGSDIVLVAYKPRKGKYAVHKGPFTMEEVEAFVGGVLGGDTTLQTLSGEPVLS